MRRTPRELLRRKSAIFIVLAGAMSIMAAATALILPRPNGGVLQASL
jgi:hypothetical protein